MEKIRFVWLRNDQYSQFFNHDFQVGSEKDPVQKPVHICTATASCKVIIVARKTKDVYVYVIQMVEMIELHINNESMNLFVRLVVIIQ